jgi:hypothetical protein
METAAPIGASDTEQTVELSSPALWEEAHSRGLYSRYGIPAWCVPPDAGSPARYGGHPCASLVKGYLAALNVEERDAYDTWIKSLLGRLGRP